MFQDFRKKGDLDGDSQNAARAGGDLEGVCRSLYFPGWDLEGGSQESVASMGGIEVGVRGSRQGSGWPARETPLAPPQGSSRIHLVGPEELRRILQNVSGFSEKGGFRWALQDSTGPMGGMKKGVSSSL